jgi:hypothetical protein
MSERAVRTERSGWRDEALSRRHRKWGWDCPGTDFDFIEYDGGRAVAVVEYKHECSEPTHPSSSNIRALLDICNNRYNPLPLFGVRYAADFSWFRVKPLNEIAWRRMRKRTSAEVTELQWVMFLYMLRNRRIPDDLRNWIIAEHSECAQPPVAP